jgi:2-keto-4-pentenoate hydratase/2-oxohepta-3-ene-1,7-dioic acid hydratase in catechol pathway
MRLATIQTPHGPRAAALKKENSYVDLHATDSALPASVRELLEGGAGALEAANKAVQRDKAVEYPSAQVRLLPPVTDPRKIVCLGLNYADHAKEGGVPVPKEPVLFSKFATALIGHEDFIVLPAVSQEVDFEAELVIVIGKAGRRLRADRALEHVAGYTVGQDVSARDWQLKKDGKQWMVGKTFDTFAPVGPLLVTSDEIKDPHGLDIRLQLNGTVMQESNTSQMIFKIAEVVAYLSTVFTLEPGDLIFTGTPAGVGFTRKPPVFLKHGDVVEIEIAELGVLRNTVVQET